MRIACLGECMIELAEESDGRMRRRFGGDTLNTAVYLARTLGTGNAGVAYVTGLGDDTWSAEMIRGWQEEGIDCRHVERLPGRLPGLYIIRTDAQGERSFFYWRSEAAVRGLFEGERGTRVLETLSRFDLLYLSGITLALYDASTRSRLLSLLTRRRRQGRRNVFDPNYRAKLWPDAATARKVIDAAVRQCDTVLPTAEDEALLFGDKNIEATADRLRAAGVHEIVIKAGSDPSLLDAGGERFEIVPVRIAEPTDTTGAGDSFNGCYIARRLMGWPAPAAVESAQRLAARVVEHAGAIIPRDAHGPLEDLVEPVAER